MTGFFWFVVLCGAGATAVIAWVAWRRFNGQQQAEAERAAAFLAEVTARSRPAADAAPVVATAALADTPAPSLELAQQKLLFDAARKAAEAGEPALSLQLYDRLIARYPENGFAPAVRLAIEAQKKLSTP